MEDNEWISIGDLMAGAVAIIVVLLAISTLHSEGKFNNPDIKIQMELDTLFRDFAKEVNGTVGIKVDVAKHIIQLTGDDGFEFGKSTLTRNIANKLDLQKGKLKKVLCNHPQYILAIEGHTDLSKVKGVLYDNYRCRDGCTDNVSLSLARSQAARDELTKGWSIKLKERVVCIGYGSNLYDNTKTPKENRRVEISFKKRIINK